MPNARIFSRLAATTVGSAILLMASTDAYAIPSFSAQTNQPCSACHVGAFGPQLKPYGRDFKLNAYTSSDRPSDNIIDNWYERVTTAVWGSFNRTDKDMPPQPGGKEGTYGPNDNFSLDQVAVYYGGRLTKHAGGIQELSYDGAERKFFWDAMDFRYARDTEFLGEDTVWGVTLGNQLGNTSVWNSTPPNAFPYNSSRIAPTPAAGTLMDDTLNGQIVGPGVYALWNDLVYAEASFYLPLTHHIDQAVGNTMTDKQFVGVIPFWHVALQKEFDHHEQYAQFGIFGTTAEAQPTGAPTATHDRLTDIGLEANYQYMADLHNMWSAHATYIHERQDLAGSLDTGLSANPYDTLNTFKADVTYTINDTFVPSIQYFKIKGSQDAGLYASNAGSSPNSEGFTFDLAYVPFGKPDSPVFWGNARLAIQYTAYTQFNGTTENASDNNTLFINLIMAAAPFEALLSK